MWKNKLWRRALALGLAAVCLIGTVAALTGDLNSDGKANSWDLQLAVDQNKTAAEKNTVLKGVLGGVDELRPNPDGVYEIASVAGMKNMIAHAKEGATFRLVADIDMGGMDWTPVVGFIGHFDGNGKTISNLKITTSKNQNMGLFADTDSLKDGPKSTIKNLHMRDVHLVADAGARYIGAIVGTNRAEISGCTVISTVTDTRTKLTNTVYVGTVAGRNATAGSGDAQVSAGTISGANTLTVDSNATAQSAQKDTLKVHSKMATFFADLEEGSAIRDTGIAGFSRGDGINTGLLWQDITNSTDLAATVVQQRRETVANYMYDLCTIPWTPSPEYTPIYDNNTQTQYLAYYRYDGSADQTTSFENRIFANGIWYSGTFYPGGYYRGLPYGHGSAGLDKFKSVTTLKNGLYVTNKDLPANAYYITATAAINEINDGFAAGKVGQKTPGGFIVPETMTQKLEGASSYLLGWNQYISTDCSSQAAWAWRQVSATTGDGFANLLGTSQMITTQSNINKYGLLPVGGLVFDAITEDLDGDETIGDSGDIALQIRGVFEADNKAFWEAIAKTSKGDCIMHYSNAGGHTRLALADAVVIRKWNGDLDENKSYVITAEQGASGEDSEGINRYSGTDANGKMWRSSCCVDRKTTFADLTTNDASSAWFPISCAALRESDTPAAKAWCKMNSGKVTSNFHIVSTTVDGVTVVNRTEFIGQRNPLNSLVLTTVHPTIAVGDTVSVLLSNGETYTFTY